MSLAFLRPLLLPVVKWLVGALVTPAHMKQVLDLFFVLLHKVADKLPTHGTVLAEIEQKLDKDEVAKELADGLNAVL